jgi:predicted transcriptional regulator
MELHLDAELENKVSRLAAESNSREDVFLQQLIANYIDHDEWFRSRVKEGLDQLERGEFLTHEEVGSRLAKVFGYR